MEQQITGRTQLVTRSSGRRQPSQAALATRSLRQAHRLRDQGKSDEYRAALTDHFSQFVRPARSTTKACPLRTS